MTALRRAALLASAVVLGCSTAPPRPSPQASASTVPLAQRACPAISDEELEPTKRPLATSTFTLGELFPRAQLQSDAPPLRHNLGTISYSGSYGATGRGTPGARVRPDFDEGWLVGGIRPALEKDFHAWLDATRTVRAAVRRAPLLVRRMRILDATQSLPDPPEDVVFQRGCTNAAHADAEQVRSDAGRQALVAREALIETLGGATERSVNEAFLLAYLRMTRIAADSVSANDERALVAKDYVALADDEATPIVLRVVALGELARGTYGRVAKRGRPACLQKIVDLTDDPVFELPARFDLALDLEKPAPRRAALEAIAEPYLAATHPALRAEAPRVLRLLGDAAYELDDVPGAIDAWSKCLGASQLDEDDDDDPWGCAQRVADGLRSAGGASGAVADVRVSDTFAAAIGLRVMQHAIEARDRREVERAGDVALARAPQAIDAPLALGLLLRLATDPDRTRALTDRRAADYGAGTAWYRRATLRFAATASGDASMRALLEPPPTPIKPEPTTEDEWRVELRDDRAPRLRDACVTSLQEAGAKLVLRIDTTGPAPRVEVTSDKPGASSIGCVERAVGIYFRSVPPAELTLVLTP